MNFVQLSIFFCKVLVIKTLKPDWTQIGIQLKMLDLDPYQMNTVRIRNTAEKPLHVFLRLTLHNLCGIRHMLIVFMRMLTCSAYY
jgi:hypothetical protein